MVNFETCKIFNGRRCFECAVLQIGLGVVFSYAFALVAIRWIRDTFLTADHM